MNSHHNTQHLKALVNSVLSVSTQIPGLIFNNQIKVPSLAMIVN